MRPDAGRRRASAGLGTLLAVVLGGVTAACASSGGIPQPFPRPGSAAPAAVPSRVSPRVVGTALSLRGVPYRNGGTDPSGFDCSGLVWYVFAQEAVPLPRTVPEQFTRGRSVEARSIQAGDLVFFSTIAPGPSHVGIAISGTEFVHAPSSSGVVRVESLTQPYWWSRFIGARRIPHP